jgi:hypothetical protein
LRSRGRWVDCASRSPRSRRSNLHMRYESAGWNGAWSPNERPCRRTRAGQRARPEGRVWAKRRRARLNIRRRELRPGRRSAVLARPATTSSARLCLAARWSASDASCRTSISPGGSVRTASSVA